MKNQSSYKYLLKNIGLLTFSQLATKLISFFLVPLYTSVLTSTEYGTYDFLGATIGVLLPILTLNIQEAVLRFCIDKNKDSSAIVTVGTKYLLISNLIVILGLLVNHIFRFSSTIDEYFLMFFLMFFIQSLAGVVLAYVRGIEKIKELAFSSLAASFITIVCNVVFLLVFRWGLRGYFLANIIGPFVQIVYLLITSHFFNYIRLSKYIIEEKEMLEYSKPLILNSIAWWINNVSDRYIIVFFCGLSENGIYSIAGKIPSIMVLFQNIFNQAWVLSTVKEYDKEDKNGFFTNTYKTYNCALVIFCSGIIVFNKILAKVLYSKDFFIAWKYAPWLTIAIVFSALSGYIGGFFSAVKNSKLYSISTLLGATTNVILNFIFTPIYGALGAAIATTISFFAVWLFRLWQSKAFINLKINIARDCVSYMFLVIQGIIMLLLSGYIMYLFEIFLFIIICLLYINDFSLIINKFIQKF